MKKLLGLFLLLVLVSPLAVQGEMVTYTASADPNTAPDATDGSNVWAVTTTSGNASLNGTFFNNPGWGLYANGGQTTSMVADVSALLPTLMKDLDQATESFSISFDNGLINAGGSVGFELLDDTGMSQMTFFFAGGQSFYQVTDAGGTTDTSNAFTSSAFTVGVTLDNSIGGYTLDLTGTTYGGSFLQGDSTIAEIRVFNQNAGPDSVRNLVVDTLFINAVASAVPEPTTVITFGVALVGIGWRRRRS